MDARSFHTETPSAFNLLHLLKIGQTLIWKEWYLFRKDLSYTVSRPILSTASAFLAHCNVIALLDIAVVVLYASLSFSSFDAGYLRGLFRAFQPWCLLLVWPKALYVEFFLIVPLGRKSIVNKKHNLGITALLKVDFGSWSHSRVPDFYSTFVKKSTSRVIPTVTRLHLFYVF